MIDLYRLVYTSINHLEGTESERAEAVAEILALSQRNNSKVGVTGALLFNDGCFAQVLEGPRKAVETTFERIQRDPRHSDVSVLQCETADSRGFPNWSMAFVGQSARGRDLWNEIASRTGFDISRIEGDQLFATLHAIVEDEEALPSGAEPVRPAAMPITAPPLPLSQSEAIARGGESLDVERVRSELLDRRSGRSSETHVDAPSAVIATLPLSAERAEGDAGPALEVAVLRAALAEERQRTTNLRHSLDEARIDLAIARDEVNTLRDFAHRAKALAAALFQEPSPARKSAAADERDRSVGTRKAAG